MASTDGIVVDLNDPSTLEAYNQILLFKNNPSENELVFRSPDKSRHRTLLSLAHKLDLECEYTLATRTLKISQLAPESTFDTSTIDDLLENVGGVFGDALDSTGISFSPNFEDDFSLEMPQSGQDAPLPGISNHEFRFSNHEAANSSAIALDNVFLHVEEGALGSPTWFPLDLTSLSNIGLQNNTITTPYGDEQVFGHEELCAAVECNLSTERKIAAAPDGPMRQHGQTFVGHKKHKQINALPESTDLQQSQDYLGFTNSEKTHRSVSLPEHQGTSLDLRTEREERGRGYLEQLLWRQSPTQQAEPLWENWAVSSADTGVRSMLNAEDFAEHEAARPLNGLALHSEKSAKKRKNAERSVSPIYNSQPMSTMPPSAPIPINNSPMNLPSKQTFLESVRSKVHRIICSQSQCHREFSQQGLLNEHICHDHHIAANPNLSKKNGASQLTSANGQQIDRGRSGVRNLYSRRSSLEAPQSPLGYEEIVFDARSDQSSGHASLHSNASCASGRRGPLSDAARTGMSALRAIGACWRCKFLRKPCDPETRCGWCPRPKENGSSKEVLSAWADLGCQRGTFESSTHPIVLCPNSFTIFSSDYDYTKCGSILDATLWITARQNALNQANRLWRTNLLERDKALEKIGHSMAGSENSLSPHNRRVRDVFVECFLESSFSNLDEEWPKPELIPLNECILAIAWESATSELESLVKLLPRAAAYQADHQQDQLIAQSFICLRSCLEAMRVKSSYNKDDHLPHDQCVVASCQIECFAELKKNISLYLTELSRVFFKKANMRNKQQWWLSCFYSFCIQSLVKKLLLALETRQSDGGFLACREYLQLPIKLFIAISSNHDPLVADIKKFGELELGRIPPNLHDEEEANYKVAQIAVDRCKWKADGVSGSAEYLRRLFANFEAVEQTKSTRQNADRQVIIEID